MPKFSSTSQKRLETCDIRLQQLFNLVIKYVDCTIICGHRGEAEQNKAYIEKKSKLKWPHGKHNSYPSKAVDVAPYINGSIRWDEKTCLYFGGIVQGFAKIMGINIRYGGDWNNNIDVSDNTFNDLVHFEIIE
jgi:peptidoglycan LD-endopeptidase CwlK